MGELQAVRDPKIKYEEQSDRLLTSISGLHVLLHTHKNTYTHGQYGYKARYVKKNVPFCLAEGP